MARLFLAVAAAVIVIVVWIATPSAPKVLPPTPVSLCQATDRHTSTVIRTFDDGDVEVTSCPDEQ